MRVHIEGMGILGSLIAWNLHMNGYQIAWSDRYLDQNPPGTQAWKASTGLVYPSGDAFDQQQYQRWFDWMDGKEVGVAFRPEWVERGAYWFSSKHPPHQGKYAITSDLGRIRCGVLPSFHLNAQRFVEDTRAYFHQERTGSRWAQAAAVIRAHGFTERMAHTIWGWTVKVSLKLHPSVLDASGGKRPMLYLRKGRFIVAYANPVPGTNWWYAGTSLITQKPGKARSLEIEPKFATWERHLAETCGPLASVVGVGPLLQGWRPVSAQKDAPFATRERDVITVKPLWSSGIRHAPAVLDAVMEELHAIA